ncbi:MAG: hypothetical protein HC859_11905, partial [Bacteroidia bacterium]|nr:hypothetical protein [Bacteroidia bacterium]
MEQYNDHINDLIGKYLSGEASDADVRAVEQWAALDGENQKYLEHLALIFERAAASKTLRAFDTDAAWARVRSRMLEIEPKGKIIKFDFGFLLKAAAALLVIALVGYLVVRNQDDSAPKYMMAVAAGTSTVSDTLPDGSDVFLNRQSSVEYTFDKEKEQHVVKLSGEAHFVIEPEKKKKDFIVQAGDLYIKDIGTSFNVKAYPGSGTVEVVVQEGVVMFYTEDNPGIQLHAGGKGVYHKESRTFTVEQPEPNVLSYKTHSFVFSDADLQSVTDAINKEYDRKIVLGAHLATCRLTVTFNQEEIEVIATIIAETLGLTI